MIYFNAILIRGIEGKKEGSLTVRLSSLSTQHQPMLYNNQIMCQLFNMVKK